MRASRVARLIVMQVLPALEGGGVERGTLEIGAALAHAGHRSLVVSAGGRLVEALRAGGSEHFELPVGRKSPATLLQVMALRRLLHELQPDVLHVRSRLPAWVARLAWRSMPPAARPHFVSTVHGFYHVGRYSAVMMRAERVIAVSEAIHRYILHNYPHADGSRIQVIARGIDHARWPHGYSPAQAWWREWWARYPMLRGRCVLCLPGRITRLKGHMDLLPVLRQLLEAGLPAHALVVGGEDPRRTDYARELHRAVRAAGLGERVTFTGVRDDMREVYAACDLVLSLSRKPESFGRTVLEAASLGVPVIGYDHGGVGEVLATVFPAGRVPVGDTGAVATRAAAFLRQRPRLPETTAYPLSRMLERTLALYTELCGV